LRLASAGPGFRLRFVLLLLLVAVIPVGAAAWTLGRPDAGGERERADLRLATAVELATAAFADAVAEADGKAARIAASPRLQRALVDGNRPVMWAIAGPNDVVIVRRGRVLAGRRREPAVTRTVTVVSGGSSVGRVVAQVPLDDSLAGRLERTASVDDVRVAIVRRGRVLGGAALTGQPISAAQGRATVVQVRGDAYRALAGPPIGGTGSVRVAALMPSDVIDTAVSDRRLRAILAALATLFTVGFAGYVLAPALARGRAARKGLALVGDALAATHDTRALLPVILETAVEATGARGGRLLDDGREIARAGSFDPNSATFTVPLPAGEGGEHAELQLTPPPDGFDAEARELARWLAAQGAIALENARLHAVVREQAVTDPLTELANRRRFMAALGTELQRAERFGESVALVLADLDNFKSVNDTFGHQTGDRVLASFADVLRERVRDIDLAARLGGEEFAILLPETDMSGGERLAERLRDAVERLRLPEAEEARIAVTASFGVAAYPDSANAADLLAAADAALYAAKLRGKNRVVAGTGNAA
jgi:diguanylate cyclase (GGDEF)-like protein